MWNRYRFYEFSWPNAVDLNHHYITWIHPCMLASHTALIIHLHQMLQLQHKLQQHDLEKKFWPVPRTFRCVSELLSDYIFFIIYSKNKRPSISSWHFIFILKNLLLRNLAMKKWGKVEHLPFFFKWGPKGPLKFFFHSWFCINNKMQSFGQYFISKGLFHSKDIKICLCVFHNAPPYPL